MIDEYLAVRALVGALPPELDLDESFALPASRHFRLLQRIHTPGSGQLSGLLSDADQQAIRRPHPEVLQVLDPRPLLDEAAAIGAAYGSGGLLVGETLAAGLVHGRRLWFGSARNVGRRLAEDRRRPRHRDPRQRAVKLPPRERVAECRPSQPMPVDRIPFVTNP